METAEQILVLKTTDLEVIDVWVEVISVQLEMETRSEKNGFRR